MKEIEVSNLFIYPIKSTKGIELQTSTVEKIGLKYDRNFAVLNKDHKVITARENPRLLKIASEISDTKLRLSTTGKTEVELNLEDPNHREQTVATIFKDQTSGIVINSPINDWISESIEEPSTLMAINKESLRQVKEKHNGQAHDQIAFSDASPIHLISEESLNSLNEKLENPVTIHHFRPNIVVKGCEAFEEESWKSIKIGDCIFEVAIRTERCTMITIDPNTIAKDQNQEPLRTLSKTTRDNNKVNFGIYLIPRKLGAISVQDKLEIERD